MFKIPGDRIGIIEEYQTKEGVYVDNNNIIRAIKIGELLTNMKTRTVQINQKNPITRVPNINDIIVGQIETATANVVNVKIHTINEVINYGKFTGMMLIKNQRDGRMRQRKITYKIGDIIRAKIKSIMNANYHISIECKECGVIYTFCSECGNNNMSREGQKLKCRECGNIEERIFAPDFGPGQ